MSHRVSEMGFGRIECREDMRWLIFSHADRGKGDGQLCRSFSVGDEIRVVPSTLFLIPTLPTAELPLLPRPNVLGPRILMFVLYQRGGGRLTQIYRAAHMASESRWEYMGSRGRS